MLDLPGSKGIEVAKELGENAAFIDADVNGRHAVAAAVAKASVGGPLRIVANCAGIATPRKLVGRDGPLTLEAFIRVVSINLGGTLNVMAQPPRKSRRPKPSMANAAWSRPGWQRSPALRADTSAAPLPSPPSRQCSWKYPTAPLSISSTRPGQMQPSNQHPIRHCDHPSNRSEHVAQFSTGRISAVVPMTHFLTVTETVAQSGPADHCRTVRAHHLADEIRSHTIEAKRARLTR